MRRRLRLVPRGLAGPALVLRAAGPFWCVITAGVTAASYTDIATTRLAGAVAILAIIGFFQPKEPIPTASLAVLVVEYTVATRSLGASSRVATCVLELVALYFVHSFYSVAPAVGLRSSVDRAVVARLGRRLAVALALAVPLAALTSSIGSHAPSIEWLGALGVVAAVSLAAVPAVLFRRR